MGGFVAMSMKKALSGIHVKHNKNTAASTVHIMPTPDKVVIPMAQHMGPPCDVMVNVGDTVKVGQVVGDSTSMMTAPIHASVSGTVEKIEDFVNSMGMVSKAVIIAADREQTLDPSLEKPVVNGFDAFIKAVRASGLVGLGGAGFPTHVKLNPRNLDKVDTLVINAAECEPYITSDHHTALLDVDYVMQGIAMVKKFLELSRVVIGVEDNKPDVIAKYQELCAKDSSMSVTSLKSKYPQGAEKVLIYETTGRIVAEGMLPADVGVVVMNITSVAFLAKYMETGIPLVSKTITVDGGAIAEPKVVTAPLGTMFNEIIDFCGGFKSEPAKLIMGGPMMGITVYDMHSPLLKNNNAILAFSADQVPNQEETPCIRCGRCVRACPFDLMPAAIERAYKSENVELLAELKANLCMECGCCAYVCPAKRHLVTTNKMAKKMLRDKGGKR